MDPIAVSTTKPARKQVNNAMADRRMLLLRRKIHNDQAAYMATITVAGLRMMIAICGMVGNQVRSHPKFTVTASRPSTLRRPYAVDCQNVRRPAGPPNQMPTPRGSR